MQIFTTGQITDIAHSRIDYNGTRWQRLGIHTGTELLNEDSIRPGQFFNLRSQRSKVLLGRPISVNQITRARPGKYFEGCRSPFLKDMMLPDFYVVIAENGTGTKELVSLRVGDKVELLGPLGNGFPEPEKTDKICLVGGGIGAAPILGAADAYDFDGVSYETYLCFKEQPSFFINPAAWSRCKIALERIDPEDWTDETFEEGMLDAILKPKTLETRGFTKVYACGPKPMLKYVRDICKEVGVKAYLSLENFMACGVGVCLGCTIPTTEGNKRCCKDGPVFDADILDPYFEEEPKARFAKSIPTTRSGKEISARTWTPNLKTEIAGVKLKTPIIAASGTFGYGTEYADVVGCQGLSKKPRRKGSKSPVDPLTGLGAICSKGLTLEPRSGNSGRRIYETPSGMMNSIGLENPGIEHFIDHELKDMLKIREERDIKIIANLSGKDIESYVEGAKLLTATDIDMIELNISCPNRADGVIFGKDPKTAFEVTRAVKLVTTKPLIVKLTPNTPDIVPVALKVLEAGADAISLINTISGLVIDTNTGKPVFDNVCAGLSGPAIMPIAVRMVYEVGKAMLGLPESMRIPIIGLGGIATSDDAVQFIMAGATAIQVGTAFFADPLVAVDIEDGIREYMRERNFYHLHEIRGVTPRII